MDSAPCSIRPGNYWLRLIDRTLVRVERVDPNGTVWFSWRPRRSGAGSARTMPHVAHTSGVSFMALFSPLVATALVVYHRGNVRHDSEQ